MIEGRGGTDAADRRRPPRRQAARHLRASALAVRTGLAIKPDAYTWRQLAGAGALAGIGFTMSLFIAGQAFPDPADFAAAKLAVFAASILAALTGAALLWNARTPEATADQPLVGSPANVEAR